MLSNKKSILEHINPDYSSCYNTHMIIYLETERILLRRFQEKDLNDIFSYASVEGVGESAGWKHHQNIEETKAVLYNVFLTNENDYAIIDKETNKVIGSFGLHTSSRLSSDFPLENAKELGYVLSKDYWGKGIMTEILSASIKKWKEEGKIDVLTALVFSDNSSSMHVLEKCGFRHYRIIKDVFFKSIDEMKDEYCFYLRIKDHE